MGNSDKIKVVYDIKLIPDGISIEDIISVYNRGIVLYDSSKMDKDGNIPYAINGCDVRFVDAAAEDISKYVKEK